MVCEHTRATCEAARSLRWCRGRSKWHFVLGLLLVAAVSVHAQADLTAQIATTLDSMVADYYQSEVTVAFGTFTYGYTGLGSSYSRYLEDVLSQAIAESRKTSLFVRSVVENMDPEFRELYQEYFKTASVDGLLYGRFWEDGEDIRVDLELTSLTIGQLIGRASIRLPGAETPPGVAVAPPGAGAASAMQAELTDLLETDAGDLIVKVTTSRGDGAVYRDGEDLQLHVFVNRNAFLKVYHVDANGVAQLIFPNRFQPQNRIGAGQFVQLPSAGDPFRFRLGPPYGIEFIKVVASTVQFEDIEQSFQELGTATRSLLSRGLRVTDSEDRAQAEALVSYSIVGAPPELLPQASAGTPPAHERSPGQETRPPTVEVELEPVFPVFLSWYDDNPLGRAVVTNNGPDRLEDVRLSLFVRQYMDNPKEMRAVPEIGAYRSAAVDIYGLFTSDILEITEGVKVSALVTLRYTVNGNEVTEEFIETVDVQNRNALTWDDDQKICAFVTAKDPAVMRFARNVSGYIQERTNRGVTVNLMSAMALHEALDVYGMHYIPDPTTPYIESSREGAVIDYLQFPRQTLEYQGGDCDDLSALYAALLESLGIETAFITVPGHIFVAFNLGISAMEARRTFAHPDDLIFVGNTSWAPVEVTLRNEGFLAAWQAGAAQWRENRSLGRAGFYPVHSGWQVYPPVGLPGSVALDLLDREQIATAFSSELLGFIGREIDLEATAVQHRMETDPRNPRWPNRLGVVYGRYGVDDRALSYFQQALRLRDDYVPALVNLGNVRYLAGDVEAALDLYEAAEAVDSGHPDALVGIARIQHDLQEYGNARRTYARLQQVAPSVAGRFAYLGLAGNSASRAAESAGVADLILWSDERDGE